MAGAAEEGEGPGAVVADDLVINDQVGGLMSFEEFKDSLIRGIEVIKFNRRGAAAFRTLTLLGDHTLTWLSPKEVAQSKGDPKAKGNFDVRDLVRSHCAPGLGELPTLIRFEADPLPPPGPPIAMSGYVSPS